MKKLFRKWREASPAARSSIAFVVSTFILQAIGFLTTPIFTRIVDQAQYGVIGVFNSWLSILEVFALLGLNTAGAFNVGLNDYPDERDRFTSTTLVFCNLVTVLLFGILFAVKAFLGEGFILPWSLFVLLFLRLLITPAQTFWITRAKYEFRYRLAAIVTILSSVLSQVVAIFAVKYATTDALAEVKLWSSELVLILFALPIYIYLIAKGKTLCDRKIWKQLLVFSLPLLPHHLSRHVMSGADKIMLANLIGEAEAGIYSIVQSIGFVTTVFWTSVNGTLISTLFDALNRKEYGGIRKLVGFLLAGYGIFCFGITLLAPEVILILGGEDYLPGLTAIPPIIAVSYITGVYSLFSNVEFYHKRTFSIAAATVTAAVLNVVLNALLIPRFSITGAAYTTLASNVLLVLFHYVSYRRAQKDPPFSDRVILLISLAAVALCELSTLLYRNDIVRYSVIGGLVLLAILVLIFRKKIPAYALLFPRKESEERK